MKTFYQKMSIASLLALALCLSACVDDGYDLGNASTAFQWEGALGLPVVAESTVTVEQLVNKIKIDENAQAKIIIDERGVLCLQFDTAVTYELDKINRGFKNLNTNLFENITLLDNSTSYPIGDVSGIWTTQIPCNLYSDINVTPLTYGEHYIKKIVCTNAQVVPNFTLSGPLLAGSSLTAKVILPGSKDEFTIEVGDNTPQTRSFTLDLEALHAASDQLTVELTATNINPNGLNITADLSLNLNSAESEFVAYGWFNYTLVGNQTDVFQAEEYAADIWGDLKDIEKRLSFTDSRFDFDVTSTFGVPLEFKLNEIKATLSEGSASEKTESCTTFASQPIARAVNLHESVITKIESLDKTKISTIGDLINTELSRVSTEHSIGTEYVNVATAQTEGKPIQFISSKDKITVRAMVTIPFTLAQGDFVTYLDTMAYTIDLGEDFNLQNSVALVRIGMHNGLPLPLVASLWLAEEDGVDAEGKTKFKKISETPDQVIDLPAKTFTKTDIEQNIDRVTAKKGLIMEYKMKPLDAAKTIFGNDFITVKVGVGAKAKITGKF